MTHHNPLQWTFVYPGTSLHGNLSLSLTAWLDRLVPIELPTRRRRVFRIVAMTATIAVCLTLRAAVLIWLADRSIFVNTTVSDCYFLLLLIRHVNQICGEKSGLLFHAGIIVD